MTSCIHCGRAFPTESVELARAGTVRRHEAQTGCAGIVFGAIGIALLLVVLRNTGTILSAMTRGAEDYVWGFIYKYIFAVIGAVLAAIGALASKLWRRGRDPSSDHDEGDDQG